MVSEQGDNLDYNISHAAVVDTAQTDGTGDNDISESADAPSTSVQEELTPDEITSKSIAEKHGIDFIRLSEVELPLDWIRILSERFVIEHKVIAVKLEESTLYVAMSNPLDLPTINQINLITGFNVTPMVATERDISNAIRRCYSAEQMSRQDFVDARLIQNQIEHDTDNIKDLGVSDDAEGIVRLINSILRDAIDSAASDIHFESSANEMFIRFRVDGILRDIMKIPVVMQNEIVSRVKVLAKLDITEKRHAQDGHISLKYKGNDYDLRISVILTVNGEKVVIRVLDKNRLSIDMNSLGIRNEDQVLVKKGISRPYGLILVTGPTGCGKTSTLYTMLRNIDAIEKNIITIENPVEYKLDRINQVQVNSGHGETFASSLRSILRQDPDVIMVGEIRDLETAEIAVQAALTGHLVISTLHTNDSVTAITRLKEIGIPSFLIASCTVMVIAQRLVRKICPDCKVAYQPDREIVKLLYGDNLPSGGFVHGKGCNYCFNTGFRGREGVFEILKIKENIQNAILHDENALEIGKIAVKNGMKTLLDSAMLKISEGTTTIDEIKRVVTPEKL